MIPEAPGAVQPILRVRDLLIWEQVVHAPLLGLQAGLVSYQ